MVLAKLHTGVMFDWDDLRYFLAFARTGSMLAAAKASRVNQSTVQRRITELESRIGQQLVVRHVTGYRTYPGRSRIASLRREGGGCHHGFRA